MRTSLSRRGHFPTAALEHAASKHSIRSTSQRHVTLWQLCIFVFLLCTGLLERAQAIEIVLERLYCERTEDSGNDECRLDIYADDTRIARERFSMSAHRTHVLVRSIRAEREVRVRLTEEDSPDPDDALGTVVIRASAVGAGSQEFTGDGARYRLDYRVVGPAQRSKSASAYRLHLLSLECIRTEDASVDECVLDSWVDGRWKGQRQRDMATSGLWVLGNDRPNEYHSEFRNGVRIRLTDRDTAENLVDFATDRDDVLGEVFIAPHEGRFTQDFRGHGAHYRLNYRVSRLP